MNNIVEGDVVMDPVSNWLKKHNELNKQLQMKMKQEPIMRFSLGGLTTSFVPRDPFFGEPSPFLRYQDGGAVNPIMNLLNLTKTASDIANPNSALGSGMRDLIRMGLNFRR